MPQLDPISFSSQLFWLTISFVALYILCAKFLLPQVKSVLDLRAQTINNDITQAENNKSQAEQIRELYEKALAEARHKAQTLFADTQKELSDKATARQTELDAKIAQQLADSEAGIITAKKEVMNKLTPITSELASTIVQVLVNYKPDSEIVVSVVNGISKESNI